MSIELTLEQQFELRRMNDATEGISREQAINLLIEANKLAMIKQKNLDRLRKDAGGTVISCELDVDHHATLEVKKRLWQQASEANLIEELVGTMSKIMLVDNALRAGFKRKLEFG